MTYLLKLFFYIVLVIVIIHVRTGICGRKGQRQPLYDGTLKDSLVSAPINLTRLCVEDFSLYLQRLDEGTPWALKMFDSSAKFDSGMLKGGHSFLGFYSECVDALPVDAAVRDVRENSTVIPDFSSIYCLSTMRVTRGREEGHKSHFRPICDALEGVDLTFGVCAPSTCNEEDIGKIAAFSLRESGCTANATSTVCRLPMKPLSENMPALAVAVVLGMFTAVVLGATVLDYERRDHANKCENPPLSSDGPENTNAVPRSERTEPQPDNGTRKAIRAFSLLSNAKKVFGTDSGQNGAIRVLHGLRFFSMAWVICLHGRYASSEINMFRNMDDFNAVNFKTKLVDRVILPVDTFFFIGGLLVAYSTLKQLRKSSGKKNWFAFYAHRYFRTVPLVMVVVAICAFLVRYFGAGPRWEYFTERYETNCRISWWTYLLYVQNLFLHDHQCLGHTWYSAADFQLYLVSPPILYALYKKPRLTAVIIGLLALLMTIFCATYTSMMTVRFTEENFDYNRDVYQMPYGHITPYLMGMLMGLFLSQSNPTLCPPRKLYVYFGWLCCAFCLLFSVYGLWICDPYARTPWAGTFVAFSSALWVAGIAWIVYASVAGCGGIVTTVLASHALQPLGKLTFSVYVLHWNVEYMFFTSLEGSFYYSSFLMSYIFAGNLLLCYAISVIASLFIELPLSGIERLILCSN